MRWGARPWERIQTAFASRGQGTHSQTCQPRAVCQYQIRQESTSLSRSRHCSTRRLRVLVLGLEHSVEKSDEFALVWFGKDKVISTSFWAGVTFARFRGDWGGNMMGGERVELSWVWWFEINDERKCEYWEIWGERVARTCSFMCLLVWLCVVVCLLFPGHDWNWNAAKSRSYYSRICI